MKYPEKQKLFDAFLLDWEEKLQKVPSILDYISRYPELFSEGYSFTPISLDEIYECQLEWVSLVAQLDNPIEKTFFRNYWVPAELDEYTLFIDLSSDGYPLFDACFYNVEPYRWYKKYIVNNLDDLLLLIDDPKFDLEKYKSINEENYMAQFNRLQEETAELIFAGKLEGNPLKYSFLFTDKQKSRCELVNNTLTITYVKSDIISLLPLDMELEIQWINPINSRHDLAISNMKTVMSFAYLIINAISRRVTQYKVTLSNKKDCYAVYAGDTIKIIHEDTSVLKTVMQRFDQKRKL